MVNLEWYRTFKAIYQNGTLTKAAEELMISQPNVSIQLASLETYIGHTLFIRLPRRMEPTEYGKRLYTQIVEAIDSLERVESDFKKSKLIKAPLVRLGTPHELFVNYLAVNAGQLSCNLEVKYGMADQLTDQLESNDLDIAIITKQSHNNTILTYESLFEETFMIVCSPDYGTEAFDNILDTGDLDKIEKYLKKEEWCAYANNLPIVRRFWRENFKKRPILRTKITVPDNNALLEAVAGSNSLTVSSDLIAGKALKTGLVKILWSGSAMARNTLYLAYDKSKIEPKQIDEIRNFINKSVST